MNDVTEKIKGALNILDAYEVDLFLSSWTPLEEQYKRKLGDVPITIKQAMEIIKRSIKELLD
jgi:hypothetical protein